ncbi:MAG TPA: hypothetical protein VFA79_15175 [Myxococcales bacterium]|nr:hypothetical protein [Myxococcales bacterium]
MRAVPLGKLLLICCAALALVPILPAYLPLVDFPQHVALHAIWNHIHDPAFNLNGRFEVTLATPYVLSHLLAHAVGQVVGPEGGLRFVLVVALVTFPLAAVVFLRAFDRPPELALAAAPAALSFVYWFGFTSYVIALPLVLVGVASVRRCAASGRLRDALLLGAVGLVTVATHGFAFLVLLLLAGVAALATTRAFSRLALTAGALVPAFVWAIAWYASMSGEAPAEPLPTQYGFFRDRLRLGLGTLFGTHSRDPRVLAIALALLAVAALAIWRSRKPASAAGAESGRRALLAVASVAIAASLLCPEVLMNTWGLWERIPPIAFVALVGTVRWPAAPAIRARLAVGLTAVVLFAAGTAVARGLAFSEQVKGIRELAQELPRGARIFWSACGEEFPSPGATPAFKHLGAYVQAERGGDLSYSFAHFPHMVVRYRGAPLPEVFDRSLYDLAVLRLGPKCPSLDELRRLGPLAVRGSYVALPASAVTPELAAAMEPEHVRVITRTAERRTQ